MPVDLDLRVVEAGLAARRRGALEDLRQRPAERLAPEGRRQAGPLLVVEPRLGRRTVVVLERAATLLGPHQLDAVELAQDPHVVGNVAERIAQLAGEFVGAPDAALVESLEDALAERMGERFRKPLVQLSA